jgi:hypothetical protein
MLSSKWWNNKTSDIKLVYLYSSVKMMYGPINIRFTDNSCGGNQNTHLCSETFFSKILQFRTERGKKTRIARWATDNSTEHAHRIQYNYGYKHTLETCNPYSFFHDNKGYANAPHCYVVCIFAYLLNPLTPNDPYRGSYRTANLLALYFI